MTTKSKTKITRILLVDDHAMVREGLAEALSRERDLKVCGEAADAAQALALTASTRPHLAIVDLTLKNSHGLDLIKDLHARHPEVLVLVLSMHDESLYAERVIRAGARGFMNKVEATHNLLSAIRRVLAGEIYMSETAARQMVAKTVGHTQPGQALPVTDQLSDRELQIFQLLGRGRSVQQIGAELNLGLSTVETYRARLKEKLGAKDANELLQHAIRWNESQSGAGV